MSALSFGELASVDNATCIDEDYKVYVSDTCRDQTASQIPSARFEPHAGADGQPVGNL